METAWIQVFLLTLTQCIAPPGKLVCQEESVEFLFAEQVDCEVALVQMLEVAARVDTVIVNRESSHCRAVAKEMKVYASAAEAGGESAGAQTLTTLQNDDPPPDFTQTAHRDRLDSLQNCDKVAGVAPCKIGEIIIEAAGDLEIWRGQN